MKSNKYPYHKTGYADGENPDTMLTQDQIQSRIDYIKELKEKVFREGIDYDNIPGESLPCLSKAGAEKLKNIFNFYPEYQQIASNEQPFKISYPIDKNGKKQTFKGYFAFNIQATIRHRRTNEVWGSDLGYCHNNEPGYEFATPNQLLKIARKRAMVGAVLDATGSSDIFTINLDEDKKKTTNTTTKRYNVQSCTGIKSIYGTVEKMNFCHACKKYHIIEGDEVIYSVNHGGYASVACAKGIINPKIAELLKETTEKLLGRVEIAEMNHIPKNIDPVPKKDIYRRAAVNNKILSLLEPAKNNKTNLIDYIIYLEEKVK